MLKKKNNIYWSKRKIEKKKGRLRNIYFVLKLKKKINVIKKNYCIDALKIENLNCKNLKKQDIEKFIKTIHEFLMNSNRMDLDLIGLEELYKRSRAITKRFGDWEEKIMDIDDMIGKYQRYNYRAEKAGLVSKVYLKKNKISEWQFKNSKKWLKIYKSKMAKKRKNPELIKINRIISEILGFCWHFRRFWWLYWKSIYIHADYAYEIGNKNFTTIYNKDTTKEINYNCSIKNEFLAIDRENLTKIEIYGKLKENWLKKGYNIDLYKKKYDNSEELAMFEKEMINLNWSEIVARKEEYTIYALYLKFLSEILSNKKLWVI